MAAASPSSSAYLQQQQQQQQQQPPPPPLSLDAIVGHFVASKRSLAATEHVYRANAIVDAARTHLEEMAVYAARASYMRQAANAQVLKLKAVRLGLERVGDDGHDEFKALLATLDSADAAVKNVLSTLKTTTIEPSLRDVDDEPRSLHTFVDEQGMHELAADFRTYIDQTNNAQNQLDDSNAAFDDELATIVHCITPVRQDVDLKGAAVLFKSLEEHAAEMASLLQSLVRHYDLCATALKHTEGGGEAAEHAAQVELPEGIHVDALPHDLPSQQPMSAEERAEMLQVLDNDAAEVDDVVQEIRERVAEMEHQAEQIADLLSIVRDRHAALEKACALMTQLAERLPLYVDAGARFVHTWTELRGRIEEKMEELHGLRQFYTGFLRAYDGLLVEVVRRKVVRSKMQRVAQDAMRRIRELHEDDAEEREAFKEEHGDFLPADIWPGLALPPAAFEVKQTDETDEAMPDIPKDVWQKATDRLRRSSL
ncbi:hypothetical protein FH972_024426 [Carpinus fangiana]|uniref:Autophagy protein ATG17-like domain-containing protein n=1 Tax=Carpinus fangiana TaxID=176857 RepID=A0A5N6KXZ9_9ROSI|nr:hypothetical protein FH972_024426 [Carpinus fangiana]